MNTLIATAYNASNGLSLPLRHGHIDELAAFGVTPVGDVTLDRMRRCTLPQDWKLVPADESPMQLRVHDGQDRLRFKLFYKPGSQGGGADMQLFPRFTVSLGTDENLSGAKSTMATSSFTAPPPRPAPNATSTSTATTPTGSPSISTPPPGSPIVIRTTLTRSPTGTNPSIK